jgi:hypothetical protein
MKNDEADELGEDVQNLASQHTPDFIILCEGLLGLEETLSARGLDGYGIVEATQNMYRDDDVLRYVVYAATTAPAHTVELIGGPRPPTPTTKYSHVRPMILLTWDLSRSVLVGHLPSVPSSVTPQSGAVDAALEDCAAAAKGALNLLGRTKPEAIFGDLNVHFEKPDMKTKFVNKISAMWKSLLVAKDPGQPTHWDGGLDDWNGTLDWLVCTKGVAWKYSIETIVARELPPPAPGVRFALNPWPPPDSMDLDDSAMDEESDVDPTFSPMFTNQKGSDHRPILVTIAD